MYLTHWLSLSAFPLRVYTSLFGKEWRQPISLLLHTHSREREREGQWKRERERACCTPPQGFASPQGCWGNGPAAHAAEWKKQEEKSEWMDRINEWRASSETRLTGFVSAGIEHASLAGSGRQCYLCTDLLPSRLSGDGEAASCCSFRPEPVPAAACAAHSDMGPVCCKPDRLKEQHLQGNRKQMQEISD